MIIKDFGSQYSDSIEELEKLEKLKQSQGYSTGRGVEYGKCYVEWFKLTNGKQDK